MKAELYLNGSHVATIEAPPYQWEYDGDDERLLGVLKGAEEMSDWEGSGSPAFDLTPSSGPEQQVEATPEQKFRTAAVMARDLGYFVAGGIDGA